MKNIYFILISIYSLNLFSQPCYNNNVFTSAYATGGNGIYKKEILWLTWGGKSATNLYGTENVELVNGSKSYASIPLGNNKYLCIEATIEKISSNRIKSYKPGGYSGDSMDNWYNIGGTDNSNKLIAGIINSVDGQAVNFKIKCKASISGVPVALKGIVVADAESMSDKEYIRAKADGQWKILEVIKNLSSSESYYIRKDVSKNIIQFGGGNNSTTAALAVLKFNSSAYQGTDFEVTTDVVIKGDGFQGIAIGLITPGVDFADAPEYYGSPLHTLEKLDLSNDNISQTGDFSSATNLASGSWLNDNAAGKKTNINTRNYVSATILDSPNSYLGSQKAQPNTTVVHGVNADADGYGTNEEDAWPIPYRRFSYKANFYIEGETISANIPYFSETDGYITAWIDLNGDGKFGTNDHENVTKNRNNITRNTNTHNEFAFVKVNKNTQGIATLTWTVPKNRVTRNTYVRLRIAEYFDQISSPISSAVNGEVEDHKIFIIAPVSTNPNLQNRAK